MSQPTPYAPAYNFTNYQSSNPTVPLPADKVDTELANIATSVNEAITNLGLIQRDDGALANQSVGTDQLRPDTSVGLVSLSNWLTSTSYPANQGVWEGSIVYRCLLAHTSGVFATDLAASKWVVLADFTTPVSAANTSAAAAAASATASAGSASAASASAGAAALSATNAGLSATAAAASAATATTQAGIATTQATTATSQAAAAAASATTATTQATAAAVSAATATTQAGNAATSASAAATSATTATTQAGNASTSATAAAGSATAASGSATAAATSATNAAASATAAAASAASIPKTNLSASVAPVVGNDNTQGYSAGSIWCDTTHNLVYICTNPATGAAVWNSAFAASSLATLTDVSVSSLASHDTLMYNTGTSKWNNVAVATARTNLGLGTLATQNGTFSGTSSGTNTGDQTTVSGSSGSCTGNAATATALTTPRSIGGVNFDGSAAITPTQIQPASEISDTTCFPMFVNAASGTAQQPKYNANFGYDASGNAVTGAVAWKAAQVTEGFGGTNQTTYTKGDILYASATNTLSKLGVGSGTQVLGITSGVPAWVNAAAGGGGARALASTDTVIASDNGKLLTIGGTCALALTAAATVGSFTAFVKNTATSGIQIITITPNGAENLDGNNSTLVMLPGEMRSLSCDGTAWTTAVLQPFVINTSTSSSPVLPKNGYQGISGQIWGAGGSGGKGATNGGGGGGGGGYQAFEYMYGAGQLDVNIASISLAITIGAGGAAQTTANTAGNHGNPSFITTSLQGAVTAYIAYAFGGGGGGGSSGGAGGGGGSTGWGYAVANPGLPITSGVGSDGATTTAGTGGKSWGQQTGAAAATSPTSIDGGAGGGNSGTPTGASAFYGGAGGGCAVATTGGNGGHSQYGGGGGGGAGSTTGGLAGTTVYGGLAGAGASAGGNGGGGNVGGGGGGGCIAGTQSGAGGSGYVIIIGVI